MLEAYFDDSGTHDSSDLVVWGGFVASEAKWITLDQEWRALLAQWELNRFHMYDIIHGDRECLGWIQGKKDRAIFEFREIIIRNGLVGIGVAIPRKDWDEIALPSKHFSFPAAMFGLSVSIAQTRYYMKNHGDKIRFIFDDGKRDEIAIKGAVDFYTNDGKKPEVMDVLFQKMQNFTGLQAADMLAWETYRYAHGHIKNDKDHYASAHFSYLLSRCELHGEFYTRDRIITLVENAFDART